MAVERLDEAMKVYRIVERQSLLENELYWDTFDEHGCGDLPWSGLWLDDIQPARMTVFALSLRADKQMTVRGQVS